VEDGGPVAGIAVVGPQRPPAEDGVGEVWQLNVAPEAWGRGYGRALLDGATAELRGAGYREAVVWMVDRNRRARAFYEGSGWAADGAETVGEAPGFTQRRVRYRRVL
jgi:ribosomal protein S18 acetylase RimI-like enzyme